jgi:hypothetical protein
MKRCENCAFFEYSQCKKHAPIIFDNKTKFGIFPTVFYDWWCGDWEPKDMLDFMLGKYNEPSN